MTDTTTTVTLPLTKPDGSRTDYTITDDRGTLAALAPAILGHLGCSFEIRWPDDTEEKKADRARSRQMRLQRNQVAGSDWVFEQQVYQVPETAADYREALARAYAAGANSVRTVN